MKLLTFFRLLSKKLLSESEGEYASHLLGQRFSALWNPKTVFSEYGKIWLDDEEFFKYYRKFEPINGTSAERKFFLRSLLSLVENLPGDTAECGAYQGASSWLICEKLRAAATCRRHYIFDSFEGLSEPSVEDGDHWKKGDLSSSEERLRENLSAFQQVNILKGWIPDRFDEIADHDFCFVHIDVDLYEPTLASLRFFYPRLIAGGIILCDDYGYKTCPGATRAFNEFMSDKPERIVHVPTGQGFIIKSGERSE